MTNDKKTPTARRIYLVHDSKGDARLVNASSVAQAVGVVYEPKCKVATSIEVARLCTDGVRVEEAA